ncbi:thioredoxin fold domain-containing protein [Campylobacter sp. US33a]|uniref:thioredoxin fold domain-containing protein n=1 Tax=Campylobacter sp. US33a TaxID=2498120 RepID=UPI001067BE8D|nr:thioredoxin fold domain-containing protein [Campylobacter sp. US33a]TEY00735.1 hypothetical protein ELQ16_08860 [Campylobacter sp. US33a]
MKKKIILSIVSLCIGSYLFASDTASIIEFYQNKIKAVFPDAETKVDIVSIEKIPNMNFEKVIVNIKLGEQEKQDIFFKQGNIIMPDIVDLKSQISYKEKFRNEIKIKNVKKIEKALLELAQKETKKISLGDKSKPEIYVFSDPECPYCRRHLAKIDNILKTNRIHFIFTTVHGESAFEKIALIYKEASKAKDDNEKLKIIKHYYDSKTTDYSKVDEKLIQEAKDLLKKYSSAGLESVPTIIKAEK